MQWGEGDSQGWALQSLPPKLVNKLTDIIQDSNDMIVDIDTIFHTLSTKSQDHLDVLILMPEIGCIVYDEKFGDTVPMRSQDVLPFEGMGRYKLENKPGDFTLNRIDPDDPIWEGGPPEVKYEYDYVIRNPTKLREMILDYFPRLDMDVEGYTKDPIFCAVSVSNGYCDLIGVYQHGLIGTDDSDVEAADDSVDLISTAIHEIAFKLSKFRVTIHSSIYDRIAEENISIPSAFLGKDAGLEHPMAVKLSEKICKELEIVKGVEVTIFRDNNYLYFTSEAPNTNSVILRVKFADITNANGKITSRSLRNSFSKSMAINRKKDAVSKSSFNRAKESWMDFEHQPGSRLGIGLYYRTLNTTFHAPGRHEGEWKLKINHGDAVLFQKLAPAMVHLCIARLDPSMRGELRVIDSSNRKHRRRKVGTKKTNKFYSWGDDRVRYIVPSMGDSRSKHWVNSHIRRMKLSNPKTIENYRKRGLHLEKIGSETYGIRVIKGHYRGIGELDGDFDYKFGKTPANYSQVSIRWLRSIEKSKNISIQYAERGGEYRIPIGESYIQVDGWCKSTNTIYEFHGDYWHGNPEKYNSEEMNSTAKKTFGELYDKTCKREDLIRSLGFKLVVIWESDWNRIESGAVDAQTP